MVLVKLKINLFFFIHYIINMNYEQILMYVFSLILGMLLANMLKGVCGCKNLIEGQVYCTEDQVTWCKGTAYPPRISGNSAECNHPDGSCIVQCTDHQKQICAVGDGEYCGFQNCMTRTEKQEMDGYTNDYNMMMAGGQ